MKIRFFICFYGFILVKSQVLSQPFQSPKEFPFPESIIGSNFIAGDVNGDSVPDLILSKVRNRNGFFINEAYAFINDGKGNFNETIVLNTPENAKILEVTNWNNDDFPDLLIENERHRYQVLIGEDINQFNVVFEFSHPENTVYGYQPMAKDMDKNNIMDIVMISARYPNYSGDAELVDFSYFEGVGQGDFSYQVFRTEATIYDPSYPYTFEDLNGDELLDVLIVSAHFSYTFTQQNDNLFESAWISLEWNATNTGGKQILDINYDGVSDIVDLSVQRYLPGNGVGGFDSAKPITDLPSGTTSIYSIDLNNDSNGDRLIFDSGRYFYSINDGHNAFNNYEEISFIGNPGTIIDLNLDELPDIVTYTASELVVYLSNKEFYILGKKDAIIDDNSSAFPNPFTDSFILKVSPDLIGKSIEIIVYQPDGKTVLVRTMTVVDTQISINLQSLKPGAYILEVRDLNHVSKTRLIKTSANK